MKSIAKLLISLLFFCFDGLIRLPARLIGREPSGRMVVLYYHSVPSSAAFADQVEAIARAARVVPADYLGALERGRHHVAITFDDAYGSVAQNAIGELVRRSMPATIFVPFGVLGRSPDWDMEGDDPDAAETVMSEEQLRALPADLISIGSHTISHPRLTRTEPDRLAEELTGSRRGLVELLGRPISTLAFPYGEHDDRVIDACRRAGYERVFSIVPRLVDPSRQDFVRGRVTVNTLDGRLEFFLKMHGAYRWMPWASALKRSLIGRRTASPRESNGAPA